MKSKYLLGSAIVIVLIIVAFILMSMNREAQAPTVDSGSTPIDEVVKVTGESNRNEQAQENVADTAASKSTYSDETDISSGAEVQVFEVSYDGKAFSPASLDIRMGDVVFFKNNSDSPFWPASGPHPTHGMYPEFDAKAPVKPGETFQFKFLRVGEWKYHDHMNNGVSGVINVAK